MANRAILDRSPLGLSHEPGLAGWALVAGLIMLAFLIAAGQSYDVAVDGPDWHGNVESGQAS